MYVIGNSVRRKLLKIIANKVALLARIDSYSSLPTATVSLCTATVNLCTLSYNDQYIKSYMYSFSFIILIFYMHNA